MLALRFRSQRLACKDLQKVSEAPLKTWARAAGKLEPGVQIRTADKHGNNSRCARSRREVEIKHLRLCSLLESERRWEVQK